MIKALLFDLDGTLFDSTEANVKSYKLAFKDAGLNFNEKIYRKMFGLRFIEMMKVVAPKAKLVELDKIKSAKSKYYAANLSCVRQNTALLELLKSARGKYKTALVTTASKKNVENLLDHFSIDKKLFDVIIFGEDVKVGKPNPECYIKTIKKLGVTPKECCIFEDSDVGIEAAKRSGAEVVRVKL